MFLKNSVFFLFEILYDKWPYKLHSFFQNSEFFESSTLSDFKKYSIS